MRSLLLSSCLMVSTLGFGQQFMPPNDLHLQDPLNPAMTQADFNAVIDKAYAFYSPLIQKNYQKRLVINRLWSNATVNAQAYQMGSTWYVDMFGGLARRVSKDALLSVVCHELGHHLGGYPFVQNWAANEGQSDYFATQSCVRTLLEGEDNSGYAKIIPPYPKAKCDEAWGGLDDRNLCYRILMAGKNLADLLSAGQAKFETPTKSRVAVTDNNHPAGQCRLDTYVAGAVCAVTFDHDVIPGKELGSARNSAQAEREAIQYSCSEVNKDLRGFRPRCWFKSLLIQ